MSDAARKALQVRKAQLFRALRELARHRLINRDLIARLQTAHSVLSYLAEHHDRNGLIISTTGQAFSGNQIARNLRRKPRTVHQAIRLLSAIGIVEFADVRTAGRRISRKLKIDSFARQPIKPMRALSGDWPIKPMRALSIKPMTAPRHIDHPTLSDKNLTDYHSGAAVVSGPSGGPPGPDEKASLAALAGPETMQGASPPHPPEGNGVTPSAGPAAAWTSAAAGGGAPAWKPGFAKLHAIVAAASGGGESEADQAMAGVRALFAELGIGRKPFEATLAGTWRERCLTRRDRERLAEVLANVRDHRARGRPIKAPAAFVERCWQNAAQNPVPG